VKLLPNLVGDAWRSTANRTISKSTLAIDMRLKSDATKGSRNPIIGVITLQDGQSVKVKRATVRVLQGASPEPPGCSERVASSGAGQGRRAGGVPAGDPAGGPPHDADPAHQGGPAWRRGRPHGLHRAVPHRATAVRTDAMECAFSDCYAITRLSISSPTKYLFPFLEPMPRWPDNLR